MIYFIKDKIEIILAFLFFSALVLLSFLRHSPIVISFGAGQLTVKSVMLGIFGLGIISLIYMVKFRKIPRSIKIASIEITPFFVAMFGYESMKQLHASALTILLGIQPKDSLFMMIDKAIFFGKTPCQWFDKFGFTGEVFISMMLSFYSFYYIAPILALIWFAATKNIEQLKKVRRGVIFVLYGGYVSYIFIPVAGPEVPILQIHSLFFETLPDYQNLMNVFRYNFDCFPSLHTAVPWVIVFLSWEKIPKPLMYVAIFVSTGITISTMALRFHYGIDVIGGLLWAWFVSHFVGYTFPNNNKVTNTLTTGLSAT